MTRLDFDPDLERLGEALHASTTIDLAREEPGRGTGAALAPRARRTRLRPRVFAGGSLGLAGIGAALVLALGGSTAAPAFAITRSNDGSVFVHLNYNANQNLPQLNQKLASMGINERVTIYMATGPAAAGGPVTCTPTQGVSGPPVKVLVGANGTEVIAPGASGGNTAEGTFHLDRCTVTAATGSGTTGNTGNG